MTEETKIKIKDNIEDINEDNNEVNTEKSTKEIKDLILQNMNKNNNKNEKTQNNNKNINSTESQGLDFNFILFLGLIFLLLGNQNTFNQYFTIFNEETTKLNNTLKAMSVTAEALQNAFTIPQKVRKDMNIN